MKERLKAIRFLDVLIFLTVAFLTLFSFLAVYSNVDEAFNVVIKSQEKEWIYPLNMDIDVEIPGKLGITKVRIKNNEVSILSSPCPHKTCVQSPPLKKVGDWNACLPNQVFIYIRKK
ncbi:MAG: NusG domain II-containing protein [Treponema sp.]